jgi:ATP-binding cassette subfamily C (CFTR/MRP) protein 4
MNKHSHATPHPLPHTQQYQPPPGRYAFLSTSRWVGFRLDVIAAVTLAAGVFLAMAIRDRISAAILALALTQVLQLTGMLQW